MKTPAPSAKVCANRMNSLHARILRGESPAPSMSMADVSGWRTASKTLRRWEALADGKPSARGAEILAAYDAKNGAPK